MNVTLLATCGKCVSTLDLKKAAIEQGHSVEVEMVTRSDQRTKLTGKLELGLPILVNEQGEISKDGKTWQGGEPKKKTKIKHPLEAIEDASDNKA